MYFVSACLKSTLTFLYNTDVIEMLCYIQRIEKLYLFLNVAICPQLLQLIEYTEISSYFGYYSNQATVFHLQQRDQWQESSSFITLHHLKLYYITSKRKLLRVQKHFYKHSIIAHTYM